MSERIVDCRKRIQVGKTSVLQLKLYLRPALSRSQARRAAIARSLVLRKRKDGTVSFSANYSGGSSHRLFLFYCSDY